MTALISITNPTDSESIDAADVATPFNTIKNLVNGSIDDTNIATGANINHNKILGGVRLSDQQAAGSNSTVANQRIVTGWHFVVGDADDTTTKAITFPVTFSDIPIILVSSLGYKDSSDPSTVDDFTASGLFNVTVSASAVGGFTAIIQTIDASAIAATRRVGFTFIAIGTKAN